MSEPRPKHLWNGDSDGHGCADCPDGSIYRCYRDDHPCGCDIDYMGLRCPRFTDGLHRPLEPSP